MIIISEKSFVGYSSVKKEQAKKVEVPEQLTQKEMKQRMKFAQELHNKRAENIRNRFSNLPVFQVGGSLESLVAFK